MWTKEWGQVKDIKEILVDISTDHPGYFMFDLAEQQQEQRQLVSVALISTGIAMLLATILFGTSLNYAIRSSVMSNLSEIEILRSMGVAISRIEAWYQSYAGRQVLFIAVTILLIILASLNYLLVSVLDLVVLALLVFCFALLILYLTKRQLRKYLSRDWHYQDGTASYREYT